MRVSAPVLIWRDSALPSVSLLRTRKREWQDFWRKENRNLKAIESCHQQSLSLFKRVIEREARYSGNQGSFHNGGRHDG